MERKACSFTCVKTITRLYGCTAGLMYMRGKRVVKNDETTDEVTSALAQLRFLKGSASIVLAWPVVCVLACALVWISVTSHLASERKATGEHAFRDARSLSASYAEQLSRTVEQLDQITLNLAFYWQAAQGTLRLEEQVDRGLYPGEADLHAEISDRHGKIITSLTPQSMARDISDQPYFRVHAQSQISGLHIDVPQEEHSSTNKRVVFSRALMRRNGQFDGVVYLSVKPGFLASFYEKAAESENDALAVLTKDGDFVASKMGYKAREYGELIKGPIVIPSPQGSEIVGAQEFLDQRARIVAWNMLAKYPLVSVVAMGERDVYASYENLRDDYMAMTAAATILLAFVGIAGSVFSARLAWRKHQAAVITDTYRLATEEAQEGFYMARALYSHDHKITDFVIENCNERGAQMFEMDKDHVIGVRFTQIFTGKVLESVMGAFRQAMQDGFREDEFPMMLGSQTKRTFYRRIVRSGEGIAITMRDITESKSHEQALVSLANTDALTKLPNRFWLTENLPALLTSQGDKVGLLYLDLDDFKNVNNTMGHAAGDEVLRQASRRMQSALRPGDHVVRLGGDEFTLVLSQVNSIDDATLIAARVLEALSKPFQIADGVEQVVHASVGISLYPENGQTVEALLQHADTAMYAAKNSGKACFELYTPELTDQLVKRIANEKALRTAVDNREFVLHYQPRVDATTGELSSMEALVRWAHPQRGTIMPGDFIPLAEQTGLIVEIGNFVIDQACAQIALWSSHGFEVVPLSVNVSPKQFAHSDLKSILAQSLSRHGVPAFLLEIELTESCMLQDSVKVAQDIAAIKALGMRVSVDDFGTGYSSLSQLQRLDLDILKVDRAFTRELVDGAHGEAFFITIVSMAHILGMQVVAEGVETLEQLGVLQSLGCNEIQGFLVSKPLPVSEAEMLFSKESLFQHLYPNLHAA